MSSRGSEAGLEEERTRPYRCGTFVIPSIPALRRLRNELSSSPTSLASFALRFRIRQYANTGNAIKKQAATGTGDGRQSRSACPSERYNRQDWKSIRRPRSAGDFSSSGCFLDLFDFLVPTGAPIPSRDNAAGGAKLMNIADRISFRCNSI
ncbi:hypothetical protein HN011_001104 [Eciton burchellii]|nr:hypothetical protein HN011_001104 [Eciton burchellii]